MSDLISRQAAIDAITDERIVNNMDSVYDSELHRCKRATHRILASLPSAQPERKKVISRQAAIDAADSIIARDTSGENAVVEAMKAWKHCIEGLPSAQPERKRGKWVGTEYDGYADGNPVYYEWACSECGCLFEDEEPTYNFCPNCEADMRGDEDAGKNI